MRIWGFSPNHIGCLQATGGEEAFLSVKNGELGGAAMSGGLCLTGLHPGKLLYIYNMYGQLIYQARVENAQFFLLRSSFEHGVYVMLNDGRSVTARL
jgi:hypothetical protein